MTYPAIGGTGAVQVFMTRTRDLIESFGFTVETITSGGSPDMWKAHEAPIITEYRPGTYIYNDRSLVARGVCGFDDCALSVLTTVVSVPDTRRAIIDAGSKVLTSDLLGLSGYGHVLGRPDIAIDPAFRGTRTSGQRATDRPFGRRPCGVSFPTIAAWCRTCSTRSFWFAAAA